MRMSRIEKSVVRFCLALTVMVLLASGALAQSTTDGAIGVVVTDQSGAVVPGANVTALNLGTGASAIQIIPEIVDKVRTLSVHQRTPPWVFPKPDRKITDRERKVFGLEI